MDTWVDAVMTVQEKRREEIVNQRDKDVLILAEAIANLAAATRKARTSLWSALQATVLREIQVDLDDGKNKTMDCTALPSSLAAETEMSLNDDKTLMKLEENKVFKSTIMEQMKLAM